MVREDEDEVIDEGMMVDNAPDRDIVIDVKDYKFRRYKCQR
jgi:hypothetical protein